MAESSGQRLLLEQSPFRFGFRQVVPLCSQKSSLIQFTTFGHCTHATGFASMPAFANHQLLGTPTNVDPSANLHLSKRDGEAPHVVSPQLRQQRPAADPSVMSRASVPVRKHLHVPASGRASN